MRLLVVLLAAALATPLLITQPLAATDPGPFLGERAYALAMRGTTINLQRWPSTPLLEAYEGERLHFVVLVPPSAEPHTFHLHGHPWVTTDGSVIDAKFMRAGDVLAFDVIAGLGQHDGDWMYHCHMDAHVVPGMWGILRVYPYSLDVSGPLAALDVRVHHVGEPLDGATFEATLEGAPVAVRALELGGGSYRLVPDLPPLASGELVLTSHHAEGESVARLQVDGLGGYALLRDVKPSMA